MAPFNTNPAAPPTAMFSARFEFDCTLGPLLRLRCFASRESFLDCHKRRQVAVLGEETAIHECGFSTNRDTWEGSEYRFGSALTSDVVPGLSDDRLRASLFARSLVVEAVWTVLAKSEIKYVRSSNLEVASE